MKLKYIIIIMLSGLNGGALAQTILNGRFENWNWIQGQYEVPVKWVTNNAVNNVSVSKITDSYKGQYALQVINNGPSFEGPLPGYATMIYSTPHVINKISAFVRCDSISGTGVGRIIVYGYAGPRNMELGRWETHSKVIPYTLIQIPLIPAIKYDSIQIYIEASAEMNPSGFPSGHANLKVDEITEETTTEENSSDSSQTFNVFPNPFKAYTIVTFENPLQKHVTVTVYDTLKKSVLAEYNTSSGQLRIEGKMLVAGTYLLKIQSDDGSIQKELSVLKLK